MSKTIFSTNFKLILAKQNKLFVSNNWWPNILGHREYFIKTWVKLISQRLLTLFFKFYHVFSSKFKGTLSFHIEIKHPDPNMPFPEWSCEICKEPYPHSRALKGHIKWIHKAKLTIFFYSMWNNVQNKIYLSQTYR